MSIDDAMTMPSCYKGTTATPRLYGAILGTFCNVQVSAHVMLPVEPDLDARSKSLSFAENDKGERGSMQYRCKEGVKIKN